MPDETLTPAGDEDGGDHIGRRRIGLATIAIMAIHFLAKIGGFIQKRVLSHYFGTEASADAATGMERIFQFIYYMPEELLTHSLLPVFNRVRDDDGEAAAWRMASLTGTIQALLLALVTLFAFVRGDLLVRLVVPGYVPDPVLIAKAAKINWYDLGSAARGLDLLCLNTVRFPLTVHIVKVAMLGLFCTSIGSLTYVLLNAYKRFVTPALGDVAQKAGIVIGTVVMCAGFGHVHPIGYAVGFILGGIFKLLTHLCALGPKLRLVRPGFDFRDPGLRELGRLMIPLVAGTVVSKVRDVWETRIASAVPVVGTLASLDYAKKIVTMPVQVIPYAFGLALFPFLAEWAKKGDRKRVTEAFLGASRMMIFLFVPLTIICVLLGQEVIRLLYKSGRFQEGSVELTTLPFVIYSCGLVAYALEIIANQVFFAHRDTRSPFYLGLFGSAIHIAVAWLAGLRLGWGNAGIALGYATGKFLKIIAMWWWLRPRLESFEVPSLLRLIAKTLLAGGAMAFWLLLCRRYAPVALDLNQLKHAALFVVGASAGGGVIYLVLAKLLAVGELETMLSLVRRKLRRGRD